MKQVSFLLIILLFISHLSFSQTKNQRYADLSIAAVGGFSPALSYNYNWGLGKKGKFKIGTGIRFTYFAKGKTDLITAPASLTSGEKGPQVLFTENILSNFDTLKVSRIGAGYINIPIHLQYSFSQKFEVGFNIDAVGLSFGSKQSVNLSQPAIHVPPPTGSFGKKTYRPSSSYFRGGNATSRKTLSSRLEVNR